MRLTLLGRVALSSQAMKHASLLGISLLLVACADSSSSASGTDTDPSSSGDPSSTTASDETGPGSTSGPSTDPTDPDPTSADDTGVVLPECGNAALEPPEECDDGNLDPGDGCEPDCTVSVDTQQWAQTHGGDAAIQDTGYGVAFDGAGNVWAVGYEVDTVGDANIWVHSYGPDGTPGTELTFDPSGGGEDRGFALDLDADGNLVLAGRAAADAWFAKVAPDGTELWSRTVTGTSEGADQANAIAVGPAGEVLVGGFLREGNGDNDLWVTLVAGADGSELWAETVDGDGLDDRAEGVAWSVDGNPIAAGFVSNQGFNADVWVRQYGLDGSETWTQQYEPTPPSDQRAMSLAVAPDGSVAIAGTSPSSVNDGNVFFAKFDPGSGDLVQQKTFGGPAVLDDAGLALAADSESAFVVVGYKSVSSTDLDIWLRKWDAIGNVVWTQNVAGAGMNDDIAHGVAIDAAGDIAVVGELRTRANTNGDVWVAKYAGDPTG